MGKNRHTKDRLFITATEWKQEYGGRKTSARHGYQALPFDHCALSLVPYENPACTIEGVLFEYSNLCEYIQKFHKNPISGENMSFNDIIRLNMHKNGDGLWHCPVTYKIFNDNSHVVAIKTTGNVYSFDAVDELNIKAKNFVDLLNCEKFSKKDIITLQDPTNPELMALRDLNNFKHLIDVREESSKSKLNESKVRHNPTTEKIMKEVERKKKEDEDSGISRKKLEEYTNKVEEDPEDVASLLALNPTTDDVNPGSVLTDIRSGGSLTSSITSTTSSNKIRRANPNEIREARWRKMRQLGKKGYVQLQTTLGNINLEIHCDCAQRTSWNFITLCQRGYYDNTIFHRLVPNFMIQGGDPTGTGTGGESAWGKPFADEFDSRLQHDKRGVVSMANSGQNTNSSQFFITFHGARHLDLVHSIFGRVVGGAATLDRMEAIETKKKEIPVIEIKIVKAMVFTNPIEEADQLLLADIVASIKSREETVVPLPFPRLKNSIEDNNNIDNGNEIANQLTLKRSTSNQQDSSSSTSASNSTLLLAASTSSNSSTSKAAITSTSNSSISTKKYGMESALLVDNFLKRHSEEAVESTSSNKKVKKIAAGGYSNFSSW